MWEVHCITTFFGGFRDLWNSLNPPGMPSLDILPLPFTNTQYFIRRSLFIVHGFISLNNILSHLQVPVVDIMILIASDGIALRIHVFKALEINATDHWQQWNSLLIALALYSLLETFFMLSLTILRYSALFACVGCAAGSCRGQRAGGGRVGWPGLVVCVWAAGRIPRGGTPRKVPHHEHSIFHV